MNRLREKVALITGGGSGIGAASAIRFGQEGARVVIAEIDPDRGRRVAAHLQDIGSQGLFVHTDVTEADSVKSAVEETIRRFGKLDVLFNSAGGAVPEDSSILDVDLSVWDRTMRLDLLGTILSCRYAIPEIVKAGGGAVVNMSSGAALRGSSPSQIYTAAKGAVLSLTRVLAGSHAQHNIRVNAICAGRILTDRILKTFGTPDQPGPVPDRYDPAGRVKAYPFWVGEPQDIANIALFLASDESRMITGAAIPADGGRSAY